MSAQEGTDRAGVEDRGFSRQLAELIGGQWLRRDNPGRRACPGEILFLHQAEIGWLVVVLGGLLADKGVPGVQPQHGVIAPFIPQGGELPVRHVVTADGACTVGRVDKGLVTQGKDFLQAVVQQAGYFLGPVGIEIGAPDIPDKQCVAGKYTHRIVTEAGIGDGIGNAVVGMSRGFQYPHGKVTELEAVSLANCLGVGNVAINIGAVQHPGSGEFGEDGCPRQQVLIAVGFENVGDAAARPGRFLHVDLIVPPGVHHKRLAPVADEVGKVGQAGRFDLLHKHIASLTNHGVNTTVLAQEDGYGIADRITVWNGRLYGIVTAPRRSRRAMTPRSWGRRFMGQQGQEC